MSSSAQPSSSSIAKAGDPMSASKNASADAKAAAAKMHRRSRSGCFTCRLRRKKCEEGKPACKACRHLGLRCEYKRPGWWSDGGSRRQQKELIKRIIKETQNSKKSSQIPSSLGTTTPPSLSHSVPTSAEAPFSDSYPPSRCPSEGSPFSAGCEYAYNAPESYFSTMPPPPSSSHQQFTSSHAQYPMFSPYEIDVKTEHEIFINNMPTRKDSTISTYSTFAPSQLPSSLQAYPPDSWVQQEHFESTTEQFTEEPIDFNFFDFPHAPLAQGHESIITVDEGDQHLLNHFLVKVLKLIFPILDANQRGSAESDVILPALESNRAYLHCCLSIAATHKRATEGLNDPVIDTAVVRHRYSAITELCEALNADTNHAQILEATLGMMFFECSVGRPDDALPDIPWHQHFQAAANLVLKLDLHQAAVAAAKAKSTTASMTPAPIHRPSFNMTLTAWIDILGSTILGKAPTFADTYRELNMAKGSCGLAELMGCDDKIMFLISEIACLDAQRDTGINDMVLCRYVESLAREIGDTELPANSAEVASCFSPTGVISPRQLTINITAVFRVAARIYLCTLVPGYSPSSPSMCHLIAQFSDLMNYIPEGPDGFDRSLVWPLLVAGSASSPGSPFRAMFASRCERLGEDAAGCGSFGRIRELLHELWICNDAAIATNATAGPTFVPQPLLRWRDAMSQKGWDYLLI